MQAIEGSKISILTDGDITSPSGFSAGGVHCGLKRKRLDLGYIKSDIPAAAAAVYTTNLFQAAPLLVTQESIAADGKLSAIIVNSGNANACTGEQGMKDAYEMRRLFAESEGLSETLVAVASTGVIGEELAIDKIRTGIPSLMNPEHGTAERFEKAILTTDTGTKKAAVTVEINGKAITIGGAAKGSGMIHPNMATMLAFITTDAAVEPEDLQLALKDATNSTFNMITVDGDTSTNDMVLLMANGSAGNTALSREHKDWAHFVQGLGLICESLAKQIARDGEGATKLVSVNVKGAETVEGARALAKTVISSNLVKTAVYGSDPNWGRIVCAVGYSSVKVEPNSLKVYIGPHLVFEKGLPASFSEEEAKDYLSQELIEITVDCCQGSAEATAWGCDLTYDYVRINASYRT
ncbi:bifunctional ornithine acetyltransferase/N-acetylglutamate synthase [Bacillus lacus]|uniref:Arginine biosynthesis bifunctional protein ArgJ n=1 Tax=Metabacillus lacus TaxID=1983721 RepID=A0A7X2LXE3_9BACI|nr:bifunctional ornithine acetyltransferase/N-acetylglutamate synthase [Metabacillus lacus]MRX72470.1 bifunctional ornithine acetyltransferase/N-acetylglutamate synthase [Metabacillus lacus]